MIPIQNSNTITHHNPVNWSWKSKSQEHPLNLIRKWAVYINHACSLNLAKLKTNQKCVNLGCASGWKYFKHTHKCYRFFITKTNWHEAVKVCQSASSRPSSLVSIPDNKTNTFLFPLATNYWTWTGGHQDSNNTWIWLDGSKVTWFNWAKGEPNNAGKNEDYLVFNYDGAGRWSDDPSSKHKRGSLCQYDMKKWEKRGKQ